MSTQPLVTIVTPSYNSGEFIEETIQSVLNQTYPHIEYIIMDGGSTDNTHEIVAKYADRLTFISEPDEGQSDAINKGWQRAQGEIIAWLCADDLYVPDTVETAVNTLQAHPEIGWVYGDVRWIDRAGNPYHRRIPILDWDYRDLLEHSNYIAQPTVFLWRSVFEQMGTIRLELHYTMDYEYWLRIGKTYRAMKIDAVLAIIRHYDDTKSASGGLKRTREIESIMTQYGASEIVCGYRYFWTRTYLETAFGALRRGQWRDAWQHFGGFFRYPGYIPRTLARVVLDALPYETQRRLRTVLIRNRSE